MQRTVYKIFQFLFQLLTVLQVYFFVYVTNLIIIFSDLLNLSSLWSIKIFNLKRKNNSFISFNELVCSSFCFFLLVIDHITRTTWFTYEKNE